MPIARSRKFPAVADSGPSVRALAGLAFAMLLTVSSDVLAQRSTQGSLYSRLGIGELQSFGSSQAQALGGEGIALGSSQRASFGNPAGLGNQLLTWAGAGLRYETVSATDELDNNSKVGYGSIDHLMFSFPILSRKLGFGASFSPYSRVGYNVRVTDELAGVNGEDPTPYTIDFSGTGGLQKVDVGIGYSLTSGMAVGASVNFVFGLIDEFRRTTFESALFASTRISNATRVSGTSATFGLQSTGTSILRDEDQFAIGAVFAFPMTLDGKKVLTIGESLDKDTLGASTDVDMDFPWRLGVGAAYSPSRKVTMMAEGRYEPWSEFDSNISLPGLEPGGPGPQDRLRLSGGVEILPAGTDLFAPYLQQIAYRVGFFTDKSYVHPMPGEDLRSYGVTGGLSFPTRIPGTRIDINLEVGRRGNTDNGLVRETYYRIGVNVNIGERWFFKRPLG